MQTPRLLIDGYNLFHAASRKRGFVFSDVKSMICQLEKYAAEQNGTVTIVLDGTRFESQIPDSPVCNLLCSEPGVTADAVMERLMAGIPKHEQLHWVLVSNDRNLGHMAVGSGIRWSSCEQFLSEFHAGSNSISDLRSMTKGARGRSFNNPFQNL